MWMIAPACFVMILNQSITCSSGAM
jgi:hypothetical protein